MSCAAHTMGVMFRVLLAASCLAIPVLARENFSAWKDSVRVFINTSPGGADIAEPVRDFPLLVRLDSTVVDFTKVKAGGADLRFADPDRTLLPHEIELFDAAAKTCLAWVRVPQVDPQSLADHIVLYWNNPAAAAVKAAVFDTAIGYSAVYHFGEEGAVFGPPVQFRDATPHGNHGDDFVSDPRLRSAIGYGQGFDGVDDRVQAPNRPSLALAGPLSVSAWVRADKYADNLEQANAIIRKGDDLPISYQMGVMGGKAYLALDENTSDVVWSKSTLVAGTYYHLAATWEGNAIRLYLNGVLDAEASTSMPAGSLSKDARPLYLGGRVVNPFLPSSKDLWDGELDEVRLSRVALPEAHYKLSYATQKIGSKTLTFERFPAPGTDPDSLHLWTYSRRIFLNTSADGAAVSGAVERFPLLVRLDSGLFNFSQAAPKGEDIRFSDPDGSVLPHAVERWDVAARKAEIWVRVPRVEGGSRTDFLRMHWGKAKAVDAQDAAAVFDTADGFAGVWHLEEGAAGQAGSAAYKDQTAGRHHGLDYVTADATAGLIGKGQPFGGGEDRVKVPSSRAFDFPAGLTVSAWIKGDAWDSSDTDLNPILRRGEGNPNAYQLSVHNGHVKLGVDAEDAEGLRSPIPLRTGLWYHVAGTWAPGRIRIYVNGALEADSAAGWEAPDPAARALYLGGRDSGDGADQFHGKLDEVQASRKVRENDWIKLSYESQRADARLLVHEGYEHKVPPVDTITAAKDVIRFQAARPAWNWDTTLAAGARLGKDGVFSLYNPGPEPLRVIITPEASPDTFGATGVEASIRILSPAGDGTRPIAVFSMDTAAAAGRSVYSLLPGVSSVARLQDWGLAAGGADLYRAATYVVGVDTLEPRLRLLGEGIGAGDSTWAEFIAEDNLRFVNLKCFPSGAEGGTALIRRELSGVPFRLAFKPQAGVVPLKLFLSVDDGRKQAAFPPPPAGHHVLSRLLPDLRAPLAMKPGSEWDLVGLPVSPAGGRTLATLAKAAGAATLRAALWVPSTGVDGDYHVLGSKDTLPAGAALWMAADKAFATLPLGASRTLAQGPASDYAVKLRKGWNLVANPSLEPLPWVASRSVQPAYDLGPVKALHAYAGGGNYGDADTLQPWKGYFVFSDADTTVRLTGTPPGLAKRVFPSRFVPANPIRLLLEPQPDPDGAAPAPAALRLEAAAYAEDGLGREDEPMPGMPARAAGVAAIREGRGLRTDLLRFEPGRTVVWKLAWSGGSRQDGPASGARFRLSDLGMPAGMTLWGASALRPGAAELSQGSELRLEGGAADTLVLWAGPAGSWREGDPLPGLGPLPARRASSLARGASGLELRLDLPAAAGVEAALYSADGRRIGYWRSPRLAPGRHAVPLALPRASSRGLILVTVDITDAGGASRRAFKALLPR